MKPELIETMRADNSGQIDLWNLHMSRLHHSASLLGYAIPTPTTMALQVAQQIAQATPQNNPDAWRVRLLLNESGDINMTVAELAPLQHPQKVALASTPLDSQEFWLRHKSTHRPWYADATAWLAANPDYFDVLFMNERGEVCEGSRSNVYWQHDGQWHTPPLSAGLLPGVWRTHLLQQARVQETLLHRDQLHNHSTVRLSNGLRGWFDVQIDTRIRLN